MKKLFFGVIALVFASLMLSGCGDNVLTGKPGSSGKTLELMIVATDGVYNNPLIKKDIDTIFSVPQVALNQPEPRFDVVQVKPSDFDGNTMFQAHRNVLILEVDGQNDNKVYLEYDKWSTPQVVIRLAAKSYESLDSLLRTNQERLLKELYNMEYRRMEKVFSGMPDVKLNNMIKEKYGFSLVFPEEFALAKSEGPFTWIRKEAKDFGIGVFVDMSLYTGDKQLEEATILNYLDTIMKHHVPGPSDGSYMGTERRDFFYTRNVKLGDYDAVETRGLWRLYNDFMSGPFVCYTLRSADSCSLITLVGYVYSPSQRNSMVMKRDLLMQVDGICRTYKVEPK